jgi:prepilin-type N-terminal cleavage/methylation domain-containing protein
MQRRPHNSATHDTPAQLAHRRVALIKSKIHLPRALARARAQRKSKIRPAFTLVELLVAITILVILTTLVLAAFQKDDGDRLNASARRLQAFAEGARSRAIRDKQVRGFRLIASARDPRVVDSIAYVGATDYLEGQVNIAFYPPQQTWIIQDTSGVWPRLMPTGWNPAGVVNPTGRNLIRTGGRIEIPAGAGKWYTVHLLEEDTDRDGVLDPQEDYNGNNNWDPIANILAISGQYEPSTWNSALGTFVPAPNTVLPTLSPDMLPLVPAMTLPMAIGVPYRMELAPALLPNTDPLTFERGVVIDLDASQVPWRPIGAPPRYPEIMEVLFDGRGNPIGDAATALVHLYLTNVADVELSRGILGHPADPPFSPNYPFATFAPKLTPTVLTVYSQTGQVSMSVPGLTDADNDNRADPGSMFFYAQRGQEAK